MYRHKYDTGVFTPHTLTNGIPVFIQRPPILTDESALVTVVLPHVGSCADPPDAPGTAHFCEHAPFQGTPSFPNTVLILEETMGEGGDVSAQVGITCTHFSVEDTKEFLPARIRCLGEMVLTPLMLETDLTAECSVIAQEYRDRVNHPVEVYQRHFHRLFYGTHPYGHLEIGELATIEAMTPAALRQFYDTYYHAGNLVIICSGDLPNDAGLGMALETAFGDLPRREPYAVAPPALPTSAEHHINDPGLGSDTLHLYYPMVKPTRREQMTWNALAACLSGWPDAPLPRELRLMRRLAYNTSMATFGVERHLAIMEFSFHLQREHCSTAKEVLDRELESLTPVAWEKFRRRIRGQRRLAFADNADATAWLSDVIVRGDEPLTLHQAAELEDTIEWSDLDACRLQLLQIQPFVIHALAE